MTTFGEALAFAPAHDALTDDVKGRLEGVWGTLPASEIGTKGVFDIARDLTTVLPDPDYDNTVRFNVATAVHETLKGFGFAADVPQQQTLRVKVDRSYREMTTLRELLEALMEWPDDHIEVLPYIKAHHQVRAVNDKSRGAWVILNSEGGIDLELTLAYVAQLGQLHAVAQWKFKERRPVTLDEALGINRRALIHPFTHQGLQGPDANGFDLSRCDVELIEALLWASATGHSAWPQQIDVYSCTEQILANSLPRRWALVLEQYGEAKAKNDGNRLVNPYWPDGVQMDTVLNLAIHFGFGGSKVATVNYQQLLEEVAQGACHHSGMASVINGGVYDTIHVSGMAATINGAIVLRGGNITGMSASGTIYAPPGVSIRVSGMAASVRIVNESREELARRAGLL